MKRFLSFLALAILGPIWRLPAWAQSDDARRWGHRRRRYPDAADHLAPTISRVLAIQRVGRGQPGLAA